MHRCFDPAHCPAHCPAPQLGADLAQQTSVLEAPAAIAAALRAEAGAADGFDAVIDCAGFEQTMQASSLLHLLALHCTVLLPATLTWQPAVQSAAGHVSKALPGVWNGAYHVPLLGGASRSGCMQGAGLGTPAAPQDAWQRRQSAGLPACLPWADLGAP